MSPFITACLIAILALFGCKARRDVDASTAKTDETKAAILALCEAGYEPESSRADQLKAVCTCAKAKGGEIAKLAAPFCRAGANRYFDRLVAVGKTEGELVLTDTAGNSPDAAAAACAPQLVEVRIENLLDSIADACAGDKTALLSGFLEPPTEAPAGKCWRFVHQTADGCIEATPCTGKGSADLAALPISPQSRGAWTGPDPVPAGGKVRLCHPLIGKMHRLKDPTEAMVRYNYPFANYLSLGRSNVNITYGAANCHGTAQAIAGGFLDQVEVGSLSYHGDTVREQCGALADAAFNAAKDRTNGHPTGAELPIGKGGHSINMNHDATCSADDCGDVRFNTFACEGGELESHVFHLNMCINCWDQRLRKAGYAPLPEAATWKDLRPGCILTQNDHSITNVFQNDGFCYFYESLSPFASPQLNVAECPMLMARFDRKWCPARSFAFDLSN